MPNVGKSSLMNYILNENKSIVTDIAGTRDSVDSFIKFYKNIRIIDTAGLRKRSKVMILLSFIAILELLKL